MRERVDRLAGDQHVELDEVAVPVAGEVVVERGVAARDGLQPVVEIEHDLVERQLVDEHHALLGDVLELLLHAALLLEQRQDAAEVLVVREDRRLDDRLFDLRDADGVGHLRGRVDLDHLAVGRRHAVAHAGRGRDEVEVELALEPLLHDLHVEQAEEAAAEAEAERDRDFRARRRTRRRSAAAFRARRAAPRTGWPRPGRGRRRPSA